MRQVGVVGLGPMGIALTRSLLSAGWPVRCYDIRQDPLAEMEEMGAEPAGSARELAGASDVVLTFLPGPEAVREVALDAKSGVLAGLKRDAAMLDMSSCGPDVAEALGAAFDAAGRRFLDCPVSRKAPDMTVLVGGEPGGLGADEEVLKSVSRVVLYCGRRGAGYAVKLLNQQVKYGWYLASAEALLVAEAMGLDADIVTSAIERSSGGESGFSTAAAYFRRDGEAVRMRGPARTIEKDLALAEVMSSAVGIRSRVLGEAVDFFTTVGRTDFRSRPYPETAELLQILREMPAGTGPRP